MKAPLILLVHLLTFTTIESGESLDRFALEVEIPKLLGNIPTQSISLTTALDEALAQNLDLAVARADEQIARAGRFSADSRLYPGLEAGFFARRLDGQVQGSFGDLQDVAFSTYQGGAALVYQANIAAELMRAFAARQRVQAAHFDQLESEQRLLLRVVELYQGLLLASAAVQITQDVVEGSERFLDIVRARVEGGLALGADVARAEAKLAADKQDLVQSRNLLVDAGTRLAVVVRRDVDTVLLPVEERLAPASYERPSSRDPQDRPDVQAAHRRVGAAERFASSARWAFFSPELRLALGYFQIGDAVDDLEGREERAGMVLWDLSPATLGEVRQRRAEASRARLLLEQTEVEAAAEIRRAEEDVSAARDRIVLADQGLDAATDTLRLSEARFKAGAAIALEVLDSQDVLAQARFNLARAIVEYNATQARLLAATGAIERTSFTPSAVP